MRQESAIPESITRLLGAGSLATPHLTTNAEPHEMRLAALATLAQWDALTIIGADQWAGYNVAPDQTADPLIQSAIDEVGHSAGSVQLRTSVQLADGRVASSVLVTSFTHAAAPAGAVLAFRVGRPFSAVDAYAAVAVAEIVSLELARALVEERQATDRRQALALYEIARHALFGEDLGETLQTFAAVVASVLDHDAVHIWLSGGSGSLRRRAAHPLDGIGPRIIPEFGHSALIGALRHRRIVRMSGAAAWTPASSTEFIVAPLGGDPRPIGVLVLARSMPYALSDLEMAGVLGTFIGQAVVRLGLGEPSLSSKDLWAREAREAESQEEDLAQG